MLKWWQRAVFYQIYPRSFADSNGDGIGDLQGIIDHLDYLRDLGIDAIWLCPHYPSPLYDCGYDVADYTDVAPEYGTLETFRQFLAQAHQHDIRVILDLVLNHTSDQHPWFLASRSSRDDPKRDWYVWRDGRDEGPPNNWLSAFGGPAWEYDPTTDQYYYHYFFKQQPDLNWHNPQVKAALFDAARFWLDMGVDGFRLDAIGTIFEHPDLPDHTASCSQLELYAATHLGGADPDWVQEQWEAMFHYQVDQPEVHELMRELRAVIDEYPDRMLVGETGEVAYYGNGSDELHLAFNFPLMETERLTPAWVRANQQARLTALPHAAWPCNTLGNHDSSRVYSHFGDGTHDAELARLSAALVLTLRGTPFLYYGEEIGMTDFLLEDSSQFRDALGTWVVEAARSMGLGPAEATALGARFGRDKCRTPMQWSGAANGGFSPSTVRTWLPVNPNYARGINVASQIDDPDSLLSFYRRLLRVRRETEPLIEGDYVSLHEESGDYLAFLRRIPGGQTCLVILNFSPHTHTLRFDLEQQTAQLLFSSHPRSPSDHLGALKIAPFEVYVAQVGPED